MAYNIIIVPELFSNNILIFDKDLESFIKEETTHSKDSFQKRMIEILNEYDIDCIYIQGKNPIYVDGFKDEIISIVDFPKEKIKLFKE